MIATQQAVNFVMCPLNLVDNQYSIFAAKQQKIQMIVITQTWNEGIILESKWSKNFQKRFVTWSDLKRQQNLHHYHQWESWTQHHAMVEWWIIDIATHWGERIMSYSSDIEQEITSNVHQKSSPHVVWSCIMNQMKRRSFCMARSPRPTGNATSHPIPTS